MRTVKISHRLVIVFLFLSLGLLISFLAPKPAQANGVNPEIICESQGLGSWDPATSTCTFKEEDWVKVFGQALWDMMTLNLCGDTATKALVYEWNYERQMWVLVECRQAGARPLENRCKLDEVDSSATIGVDHTIRATFKGPANYLRLWNRQQFYRLPVLPGTLRYLGDNQWAASFGTTDPLSGSALAPPGKYKVQCFGPAGTAGGTGTITLNR